MPSEAQTEWSAPTIVGGADANEHAVKISRQAENVS
jgi:hypothetical protein